ncbi:hypothetical protein HJC23_004348 [Cyclotella cryptica]|uniref:Mitochondrial-processing peptidase subunit alpha n=1 Tax=Cyclotella cryptica TaxID=29204 RepID=A0ABD3NZC4_9STRA|eukprot:CCRYP_019088-RA/>CCRYP_019088-RA protein AED:0.31 eAED:0.31 QI:165/1/1/1/0.5/0.33/3/843/570
MISAARSAARRTLLHPPNRTLNPIATRSFAAPATEEATTIKATFSANEFPDRDEAPTITRSSATNIQTKKEPSVASPPPYSISSSRRIGPERPSSIPANVPLESLEIPETKITTLSNGVRVGSMETFGQVSTLGVVLDYGSRYESDRFVDPSTNQVVSTAGVNHMMELLAFQSTKGHSGMEIQNILENLGGVTFATSSREQMMYGVDVLRPNTKQAFDLLGETVRTPMMYESEVEAMKQVIEFQLMDMNPQILLGEGLQMAAYGKIGGDLQQLGRPHFCTLENLQNITTQSVHAFREEYLLHKPQGIVVAGSGIEHDALVELAESNFGHIQSIPETGKSKTIPSIYTGGEYRLQTPPNPNPAIKKEEFTHIAIAFEVGGWHSPDLVPVCVLQTLLGGGSSFSAGGPGKGMYSRLYREVLNRYRWAESAEAFSSFHVESGLWGIQGSSIPEKSAEMARALVDNFLILADKFVTDEELDRARNMLKCNVLTQLESRLVLFEDIGRQILTYGKREDAASMCAKIDVVTKEDIRDVVKKAIVKPPTLSTVGVDIEKVPKLEQIVGLLGKRHSWF